MNALRLRAIASHVPARRLNVEQDYERLGIAHAAAKVFSRIYGMPWCAISDETQLALLLHPCRTVLQAEPALPERVAVLIHAHTGAISGSWCHVPTAHLARELGLRRASVMGTCSNKCVAVFTALALAEGWLAACPSELALIVVGELADTRELRVARNVAVVGDASAAALVAMSGDGPALLANVVETYPGYAQGIWLPTRSPRYRDLEAEFHARLAKAMGDALDQAGLTFNQVDHVIPHNVNLWMWHRLARFVGLAPERILLENVSKVGHCLGADMFINFESLCRTHALTDGSTCLMVSAGEGGVFGAAVFAWHQGMTINRPCP
jgi:3-oxoacyl-[acyl-carrier-protein] synthase-3